MVSYKKYSTIRFAIRLLEFTAKIERERERESMHMEKKRRGIER